MFDVCFISVTFKYCCYDQNWNQTTLQVALVCSLAWAQATALETTAKKMKMFDCGVKSSTIPSTSQTDVQIDSAE